MKDYSGLETTRDFWNSNPCGVHADYESQRAQRYAMEPWLCAIIHRIGNAHNSMLEIGCGQGVDSTLICSVMQVGGRYVGIDYSAKSIEVAERNAQQLGTRLIVKPQYQVGNAEALDFPSASFEAVYSMGVIHHTADEHSAIAEALRVLEPGGKAYIFLYRKPSFKVSVAKFLRAMQVGFDRILGTDRCFYALLRRGGNSSKLFGTMFHECFGVPYMKWYDEKEIRSLFSDFGQVTLMRYGPNFGRLLSKDVGPNSLGYLWFVEATK